MEIKSFETEQEFTQANVDFIKTSVAQNQKTKIALSGGSTPVHTYESLGSSGIDLKNIEFYQVDERYVPEKHHDSNQKMIRETLNPPVFYPFDTSLLVHEAIEEYKKILPESFDLTILGIGIDGHTGSLFPDSPALEEVQSVTSVHTDQFIIRERLTLTFPQILNSKKILVLLKGPDKLEIVEQLQNPTVPLKEFPAKKLLDHQDITVHYLTK